jgi:prepilin-type N-terminal cleavage/methylation domain-containing protein
MTIRPSHLPLRQIPTGVRGFTLIELLVVISIIAVLAGLAFPAVNGALESARKAKAKNDVTQIVAAIKSYQAEYGRLPTYGNATTFEDNNDDLMNILRSIKDLNGEQLALNPRKIAFIEVRPGKGNKDGIGTGSSGAGVFYDPWGKPYRIILDGNYDNNIDNPYSTNAGFPEIGASAIAISPGRDGVGMSGDKNATTARDDVISWQ